MEKGAVAQNFNTYRADSPVLTPHSRQQLQSAVAALPDFRSTDDSLPLSAWSPPSPDQPSGRRVRVHLLRLQHRRKFILPRRRRNATATPTPCRTWSPISAGSPVSCPVTPTAVDFFAPTFIVGDLPVDMRRQTPNTLSPYPDPLLPHIPSTFIPQIPKNPAPLTTQIPTIPPTLAAAPTLPVAIAFAISPPILPNSILNLGSILGPNLIKNSSPISSLQSTSHGPAQEKLIPA